MIYFDPIMHHSAGNDQIVSHNSFWQQIQINIRPLWVTKSCAHNGQLIIFEITSLFLHPILEIVFYFAFKFDNIMVYAKKTDFQAKKAYRFHFGSY